jgi:hypothetical protein
MELSAGGARCDAVSYSSTLMTLGAGAGHRPSGAAAGRRPWLRARARLAEQLERKAEGGPAQEDRGAPTESRASERELAAEGVPRLDEPVERGQDGDEEAEGQDAGEQLDPEPSDAEPMGDPPRGCAPASA